MTACGTTDYSDFQESSNAIKLTWKIKHFVCRCTENDDFVDSPEFNFSHGKWRLRARPFTRRGSSRFVDIYVFVSSNFHQSPDVFFKIGLRDSEGRIQHTCEGKKQFKHVGDWGGHYDGIIRRDELEAKRKELMPDDILTVVCELRTGDGSSEELEGAENTALKRTNVDILAADMGLLLKERKDCDVTLNVGDEAFQAHKIILKARSSVFASMFEHDMEENRTNVVNIRDIRPLDFKVMLEFIYTGHVPQLLIEQACGVYAAADKYGLKNLKSRCRNYLIEGLSTDWFFEIAAFAAARNDGKIMDAVKLFSRDNIPSLLLSNKCYDFFQDHLDIALEILRSSSSAFTKES